MVLSHTKRSSIVSNGISAQHAIALGDVNDDGTMDIAAGKLREMNVWFNGGAGQSHKSRILRQHSSCLHAAINLVESRVKLLRIAHGLTTATIQCARRNTNLKGAVNHESI